MTDNPTFTPDDLESMARRGIASEEVERQLRLFRDPPPPARLVRPCRLEDGVEVLPEATHAALQDAYREAARAGRFAKFVPASGAASRMFHTLASVMEEDPPPAMDTLRSRAEGGEQAAADVLRFLNEAHRFPFADALDEALKRRGLSLETARSEGRWREVVETLLGADGLGFAAIPKGLLPFHLYPDGPRTAFEEHLVEAARYAAGRDGWARVHFTVSPPHEERFRKRLEEVRERYETGLGVRLQVEFSHQHPATDTVAVDLENRPFRVAEGAILFRPGGHGALLRNLAALGADVVFVKNIDNVVPDGRKGPTVLWKQLLAGYLVRLEARCHAALRALEAGGDIPAEAQALVETFVGSDDPIWRRAREEGTERGFLIDRLHRPLRVCGVVRNRGEPGGGPFWVQDASGQVTRQIVESSQVDLEDPEQSAVWHAATHFNPVDLVCALRDHRGEPFDLERFVDPSAVYIARKAHGGRPIKALERPGLWNGAMAGWNTVFVEVPLETFAPVKTVFDLLREEHQGG